jgi:hypothetical protein
MTCRPSTTPGQAGCCEKSAANAKCGRCADDPPRNAGRVKAQGRGRHSPLYRQGDTIPLGTGQTLRVLGVRDDDADKPPVLVVEDLPGAATSAAS